MRVHFVKGISGTAAFFCDTLEIRKVTEKEKEELEKQVTTPEYPAFEAEKNTDYFSTLILNVSNTCNMKCSYCFANHGTYASKAGLMSEKTALDAVEIYYGRYKRIKQVKFFGGEPFMNLPVIGAVCRRVTEKYERKEIMQLPEFKVVTNGTIMPQKAMEMILKYNMQVVFSMDGPEEIHDYARKFADGKGTYSTIKNNFMKLRKFTDDQQPYGVEMTYSAVHKKRGMSMKDVTDFFVRELGVEARNVNISPVSAEDGSEFALNDSNQCLVDSAGEILASVLDGKEAVLDQKLFFLVKKIKAGVKSDRQLCNAGWKWSAVSTSGDVYPCFMFMDIAKYKMGNIYENLFEDARYKQLTSAWTNYDRFLDKNCKNCFANQVCINCMGQNMGATGDVYKKLPGQCAAMKKLIEVIIIGIAEGVF